MFERSFGEVNGQYRTNSIIVIGIKFKLGICISYKLHLFAKC